MIKQEVSFREATGQDAKGIIALFNQVGSETEFLIMDETGFKGEEEALAKVLDQGLESPNHFCLLALLGDAPIGILSIKAGFQDRINHIGDLFIAIAKPYWGQGIGQILMEEAVSWAEYSDTIRRLELTVQARNIRAVKLYQAFGFEIEGTKRRGAKTRNGEFLDVYLMGRLID